MYKMAEDKLPVVDNDELNKGEVDYVENSSNELQVRISDEIHL